MKKWISFACVFVSVLCIVIGCYMLSTLYDSKRESDTVQDTVSEVIEEYISQESVEEDSSTMEESYQYQKKDLIELLQDAFGNDDVIAYLDFPEANISYPIVQGSDNEEYLRTNIWGGHSSNGSIFLDYSNNIDFTDTSSIVYGHHMRSGSMFGSLERTLNKDIDGKQFTIYTRTNKLVYSIISTEVIEPNGRGNYVHTGTYGSNEFINYLRDNSKQFNSSLSGDNFVTLVTCHYTKGETIRFGATGVLVESTTYDKEDF